MSLLFLALAIVIGLVVLAWSSDKFVDGASSLARITGIPPLIIGMVIIGFGTSAPEMLVSVVAALDGAPQLALGNAIGSNITNITLVLGVTTLIIALPLQSTVIKREIPLILLAGLLSWLLILDGALSRIDGIVLVATLFVILTWIIYLSHQQDDQILIDEINEVTEDHPMSYKESWRWTLIGLVLLILSSKLLVWGAKGIALHFGVSDLVIGLTIVAIGTSLPELAASISSARKGEVNLAVGNIIGSNLFNNLGVMGLAAMIAPFATPPEILTRDLPIMLVVTVMIILFAFTPPGRNILSRWEALVFLAVFFGYQSLLYYQSV